MLLGIIQQLYLGIRAAVECEETQQIWKPQKPEDISRIADYVFNNSPKG